MPEGAEVRTFVDGLVSKFDNRNLQNIEIVGGRFVKESIAHLDSLIFPLTNVKFSCKGKFIYWSFNSSNDFKHFFFTLGMTGSFGQQQNKHSAIKFTFDNENVFFNDIRRFGTFKIATALDLTEKLNSLGWDPLSSLQIPTNIVAEIRKHNHKNICDVLLDQSIFAGLGNWLKSEILYASKINPFRQVSSLTDEQLLNICQQYKDIIYRAYQCGGATIATYSDLNGNTGSYSQYFKVYGKKKDPLGNFIFTAKDKTGRTTHYVKEVQL